VATVRQHLQKAHASLALFHKGMASHHEKLAKCFGSMGKASDGDDGKTFDAISDTHDKIAEAHTTQSEFHSQCAAECMKAEEDRLGKTLVPDGVSSIAPSDTAASFGIRAVPRPGAPMPNAGLDKATIDRIPAQFKHLLSLGDEA
jgi:hypothetical protein